MAFTPQPFLQAFELYGIRLPLAGRCRPASALQGVDDVLEMVVGEIGYIDRMQWPQITQLYAYLVRMALLDIATHTISLALFYIIAQYGAKRHCRLISFSSSALTHAWYSTNYISAIRSARVFSNAFSSELRRACDLPVTGHLKRKRYFTRSCLMHVVWNIGCLYEFFS